MPWKLYLDECTSVLLTERLRQLDQQATLFSSIEHASQERRAFSDPGQLRHAVQTSAVFVTHNIRDFYWLHRWWKTLQAWDLLARPHTGILAVPNSLRLDAVVLAISTFFTHLPLPPINNNMYVFKQNQWIREKWETRQCFTSPWENIQGRRGEHASEHRRVIRSKTRFRVETTPRDLSRDYEGLRNRLGSIK